MNGNDENYESDYESITEGLLSVSGNSEISVDVHDSTGTVSADVSAGDSGETAADDVSGDTYIADSSGNYTVSVSGNGSPGSDTESLLCLQETATQTLESVNYGNALLLLIFAFLLLSWTEKKFSVIVKRFSERKRR